MRYLGGKEKIAKRLGEFLQPHVDAATAYYEPFVGGASILSRVKHSVRCANDFNPHMGSLYEALVSGWTPPERITREMYAYYKLTKPLGDPLTAFIGAGCSFSGKWFGGYAGCDARSGRDYASTAKRGLLKKLPGLRGAAFSSGSYLGVNPMPGSVVYCDPPYAGTTGYDATGAFDSAEFWEWARGVSRTCTVFISEYSAPDDFTCVWSLERRLEMQTKGSSVRMEKLFTC